MSRSVRRARATFCPHCDKEIRSSARVCPACRSPLGADAGSAHEAPRAGALPQALGGRPRRIRLGGIGLALLVIGIAFVVMMAVTSRSASADTAAPLRGFLPVPIMLVAIFLLLRRKR